MTSKETGVTESRRAFIKNALAGAGTAVGGLSVAQTASAEERERRDEVTTNDVEFELPADPTYVATLVDGASGGTILPSGNDRQDDTSAIGDINYDVNQSYFTSDIYLEASTGPIGSATVATCLYYDFEIDADEHKSIDDISISWHTDYKLTTVSIPFPGPFSNNDNSKSNANKKEYQEIRTGNRRRGDGVEPDSARIVFKLVSAGLGAAQSSKAGTGVGWTLLETNRSGQFPNDPEGVVGDAALEKTEDSLQPGWDESGSEAGTMGLGSNDPSITFRHDRVYRFVIAAVAQSSGIAQIGSNAMIGHDNTLTIAHPYISII